MATSTSTRTPRHSSNTDGLRRDGEPEQVGDAELALGDPGELLADQQVARGGQGEGQRGHGGEHAVQAQGRDPHHDGHHGGGGAGQQEGEAQVPVPVEERHRADGGPDRGEGHLAQADLAGPSAEHDDGAADDGEDDEGRGADELAGAHPQRQRAGGGEGDQREGRGPDPDLGEVAQGGRQVAHAAGQRQRRLGLAVGAARQQLAHDDGGEDHAGQHGQPERGVGGLVPGHALLQDAEGHRGDGDDRQLGEVAQRQGGQGGDERGQPVGRVEREAQDRRLEEDAHEGEDARHHPGDRLQAARPGCRAWRRGRGGRPPPARRSRCRSW